MKLNSKRTFIIGLAFFSICAFWQMYDNIVPLILKYRYGISDGISGPIMALDNVLALFMLPLFGTLSDRKGARMPFIVIGTAGAVILTVCLSFAKTFSMFFTLLALLLSMAFLLLLTAVSSIQAISLRLLPLVQTL